jgi:hypothetical protein
MNWGSQLRIPKVKFKINLDDLFGGSYQYGKSTKEALGQAIIDRIVYRTQEKRIDKFGEKLAGYSKFTRWPGGWQASRSTGQFNFVGRYAFIAQYSWTNG